MRDMPNVDETYAGACRRALANAARYQMPYYVRPLIGDGKRYCVTDVRPAEFTVVAIPKLHNPAESELRNMEMWPVATP